MAKKRNTHCNVDGLYYLASMMKGVVFIVTYRGKQYKVKCKFETEVDFEFCTWHIRTIYVNSTNRKIWPDSKYFKPCSPGMRKVVENNEYFKQFYADCEKFIPKLKTLRMTMRTE